MNWTTEQPDVVTPPDEFYLISPTGEGIYAGIVRIGYLFGWIIEHEGVLSFEHADGLIVPLEGMPDRTKWLGPLPRWK